MKSVNYNFLSTCVHSFLTLKLKSFAESLDMSHAKLKVKMSKSFGLVTLARNSQQFSLERKEDATGS